MAMTPDAALSLVEKYCERRVSAELRDAMRVECSRRGNTITISELRPPWQPGLGAEWTELKVAQLRHDPSARTWSLHCHGGDERWHRCDLVQPADSVVPLLLEIEDDPTGIFWG